MLLERGVSSSVGSTLFICVRVRFYMLVTRKESGRTNG